MRLRLTVPHYYDFGPDRELVGDDLVRPEAWDALRTQTDGPFAAPTTREDADAVADGHPEIEARARRIDAWLAASGAATVASYGVGGATLELWLHRLAPERRLVLGEYAPQTVDRLRQVLPQAEVVRHDLLVDAPLEADVHLLHRVDTELETARWREVLARFAGARIIFVAAGSTDLRGALAELRKGRRRGATHCGWLRTPAALESLWRSTHDATPIDVGDLPAWCLEPR